MNKKLTNLEHNAVQVALDHLVDHLEDCLDDSQLSDDDRSDLEEKLNATTGAKNKFNTCIVDELFELKEWIVEQWLNDQKDEFQQSECMGSNPLTNGDFKQYNKYNLLQDAMEKLNTCIVDECTNKAEKGAELCKDCYEDSTRFGEEYNQLPNLLKHIIDETAYLKQKNKESK